MRDKDIKSTLNHVGTKRQELMTLMLPSKLKGNSITNIANLVADILGNTTKCFDYCANDIYEKYILPKLSKGKNVNKIYFPFYKKQLVDKKSPLSLLENNKNVVFKYLLEIIEKFDTRNLVEGTSVPYSIAREVRNLINEDKHDKIMEVDNQGRSEVVAQNENITIIVPESQINQGGWHTEILPNQNKTITIVKSYRLLANNEDVADFCLSAEVNAKYILDQIYRRFLGTSIL